MIIWKNNKVPLIYVFLYKLMQEKSRNKIYIEYYTIKELFSRRLHKIPRMYYTIILQEMEELELIKKIENKPHIFYKFIGEDISKQLEMYNPLI